MVTISGVRGIVGESFTPAVVVKYTLAFASMQHRRFPENKLASSLSLSFSLARAVAQHSGSVVDHTHMP